MNIDAKAIAPDKLYKTLIGTVAPRPIAFVTSIDEVGRVNAAPFAFFNVVCADPAMLMISVGKIEGERKDTSSNILQTKEFVIHIVDESIIRDVVKTGGMYPRGVNELDETHLTTIPSKVVKTPSVKEAKVRYECELVHHLDLGEANGTDMLIGQVKSIYIDDAIYDKETAHVNLEKLNPISGATGGHFLKLGEVLEEFLNNDPRLESM